MSIPVLADGWIGDPTFLGWFTVAAYFVAAWCCGRARAAARRAVDPATRGSVRVWSVLVFGLLALGVNKQLDLQSAVTALGRATVRAQGWDDHRETLQRGFAGVVVLIALALCIWLAVLARHEFRRVTLALLGWVGLCAFVGIRAASLHHVDHMLGLRWTGASLNIVLELVGISAVAIGALNYQRARC